MLRFILLVAFVYLVLRLLGRFFSRRRPSAKYRPQSPPKAGSTPPKFIDEMKSCPNCGTFNPTRLAYEKKGLYFCEARCHEAYIRGEKKA